MKEVHHMNRMTLMLRAISLALMGFYLLAGCQAHARQTDDPARQVGQSASDSNSTATYQGWPRTYEKHGDKVVLYQPQVDEWTNQANISFRAAAAVTPKDKKEPFYGVIAVKAQTFVDDESRTVLMTELDTDIRFPNLSPHETKKIEHMVKEVLPKKDYLKVSLDHVLAYMDTDKVKVRKVDVNLSPPPIFFSQVPAIIVNFMGPPQFKPIKDTRLMSAINTNWDIFLDLNSSKYYLLNGESWLTTADVIAGPWTAVQSLPADFSKLPKDANWEETRKNIPGKVAATTPKVFSSTSPAELIVTQGPPAYTPLSGCGLMYVSNPSQPLFMDDADSSYYLLVAGRWFHAQTLNGPWSAASSNLPAKFAKIPADSPVGYALASVPETQEAKDAIMLASVPHTATIIRSTAKVNVEYEGAPKFIVINGTPMKYAVNTPYSVIEADGKFYCCQQAVWFSAAAPTGPWTVCSTVPAVIYTMPPTCPLYNVTYVQMYSSTPTTVVYGYTAGYSGEYVAATGALMFGAGMLAGAAIAGDSYHYSACYCSYGCAATYHYGYGGYYRGASYYGPYGGAGHYAGYNTATGTFSRGAYRYGPYGAASVHQAYNPFTNTYHAHAGATTGYQSWGSSVASHGDQWAEASHHSGPYGSTGQIHTSSGWNAEGVHTAAGGTAVRTPNNVYAAKDGNVYKREGAGDWQHAGGSGWDSASHYSGWNHGYQNDMNHDFQSRARGDDLSSRFGGGGGFGGGRFGGFHGGGGFHGFRR
jgi:hypothetical protein